MIGGLIPESKESTSVGQLIEYFFARQKIYKITYDEYCMQLVRTIRAEKFKKNIYKQSKVEKDKVLLFGIALVILQ